MYNEQRPFYYVKETFYNQEAVDFNFYIPFFYRFNQSYKAGKQGVALMVVTKEPGERVTRLTFGGPLLTIDGVACFSRTETIPMKPTMVHFRDRLVSVLSLE
jgi:hypothetical protein